MGFSRQEYWSGVPSPSLNHVATEVEITGLLKWMGLYKALGVAPNFRSHKIWVSICWLFKRIEVLTFLYIVYTTAHRNMFFSICFFMLYIQAATAKSLQSCPTLCDPIDGSPPGSPVPGILQARTLEWVAFPSPMHQSEKWKWSRSVVPTLSGPMDCSLPGSSIHRIFQARVLEWGSIAFSISKLQKAKDITSEN